MKLRKKKKADARLATRIENWQQTVNKLGVDKARGFTKPGSKTK